MSSKRFVAFEQKHTKVKVLQELTDAEVLSVKVDDQTVYNSVHLPNVPLMEYWHQDRVQQLNVHV